MSELLNFGFAHVCSCAPSRASQCDLLVQKGFKLQGSPRDLVPGHAGHVLWARPLLAMAGDRIVVRSVLLIMVESVQTIVASNHCLYPETTTEASQIQTARRAYGLGNRS